LARSVQVYGIEEYIFEPKIQEVTVKWRKLNSDDVNGLCYSRNAVCVNEVDGVCISREKEEMRALFLVGYLMQLYFYSLCHLLT
jgi:hypothetical protein